MKLYVLGGPVKSKVHVEVASETPFSDIFTMIQEAVGKGPLWEKFQLHVAEMHDRKVRSTPRVIREEDTPASLGLSSSADVVVLQPLGHHNQQHFSAAAATAVSSPLSPRGDYRSRLLAIYNKYEPAKLGTVDATLKKFKGKENAVIRQLIKRYGPEPDRDGFNSGGASPLSPDREASLGLSTPVPVVNAAASYRDRLIAIYRKYEPSKLGTVSGTLQKFQGKEEAVIRQLIKKYGPEPPVTEEVPVCDGANSQHAPNTPVPLSPVFDESVTGSYRSRLISIYQRYEPAKIGTVDATLRKFKGREEAVIRQLVKKYGPEPNANSFCPQSSVSSDDATRADAPIAADYSSEISPLPLGMERENKGNACVVAVVTDADTPDANTVSNVNNGDSVPNRASALGTEDVSKPDETVISKQALPMASVAAENNLQVESYGFQKFLSPIRHEPLEEPLSETDGNSVPDADANEYDVTKVEGTKPDRMPKKLSFEAATNMLARDHFDTAKRFLSEFEYPLSGRSWSSVTRPRQRWSPTTEPRLLRIVRRAVASLSDVAEKTLLQRYWRKWQCKAAQHMANGLIEGKAWAKLREGAKLIDDVSPPFVVSNFEDYIFQNRIRAGEMDVDFSDDLQKALRLLLHTAERHRSVAGNAAEALSFADSDLCPVRDTKGIAAALHTVAGVIDTLAGASVMVQSQRCEIAKLGDVNEELRVKLNEAEPFVSRFAAAQEDLSNSQTQCTRLETQLKQVQGDLTNARHQLQYLQRGLKNERSRKPYSTEILAQQKDAALAAMQQELAKARTKLRCEQKKTEVLESQLKEVQLETERAVAKLHEQPMRSLSTGRKVSFRAAGPVWCLQKGAFSPGGRRSKRSTATTAPATTPSPVSLGRICDDEFEPKEESLERRTDVDLIRENLILEVELQNFHATSEVVDFGNCPHCMMRLTSCSATLTGPPDSKAAFCFSCRSSYTFGDLATRENYNSMRDVKNSGSIPSKAIV
ncbi:hypothetical protein DQ04_02411070 [Trypanosoma grayi]|uniref:hypothetical protein n=1 Tax=Trypanosoma grayi TaxID=71804 RepID=UPI0004F4325A|nr:hypothetical protein DQ04_02411070 [Trypanosoma grayi]KEG11642.1 hypothetical protein DQ04_02411070 [Trypanosoma grayi]